MGEIAYRHALPIKSHALVQLPNPHARGPRLSGVESAAQGARILAPDLIILQESTEFVAAPHAGKLLQFDHGQNRRFRLFARLPGRVPARPPPYQFAVIYPRESPAGNTAVQVADDEASVPASAGHVMTESPA